MKFDILNRITGKVQFIAEIDCAEDTSREIKVGLAVKWGIKVCADLADADLARANLARANLAGADLADANLAGANLAGADLAGANLADADLAGANLADADLAGALKIKNEEIPSIPKIDSVILGEIEKKGGTLDMSCWHGPEGWCGTTHCRAGWAVHCAGKPGKALEDKVGTQSAAMLIYQKSRPGQRLPWFFAPEEKAMADLRKCAAEQEVST